MALVTTVQRRALSVLVAVTLIYFVGLPRLWWCPTIEASLQGDRVLVTVRAWHDSWGFNGARIWLGPGQLPIFLEGMGREAPAPSAFSPTWPRSRRYEARISEADMARLRAPATLQVWFQWSHRVRYRWTQNSDRADAPLDVPPR